MRRSKEFILLSAQNLAAASELLRFAEKTLETIYSSLKEADWKWEYGKRMVLLFAEDDGGEGNWRPYRKAILNCWKAAKKANTPAPTDEQA